MSHIVTDKCAITFKSESGIKSAIALMLKEFPAGMYRGIAHNAITFEQKNPDLIVIRYSPIEGYQTKGNIRLVRNGSSWDLQLDRWNCAEMVEKVKKSFVTNYQKAGAIAYARKSGFKIQSDQQTESGSRLIAVKY